MSYPVFAIFAVGASYQIGRVAGAHCLHHDAIIKGPFADFQNAQAALTDLKALEACHV